MSIPAFHGDTFVAFSDISGFKQMLQKDEDAAVRSLNDFYNAGYNILGRHQREREVQGLLVSDCAILFVAGNDCQSEHALENLLLTVKELNSHVLRNGLMLTTSIAFGPFHYEDRLEFPGIEKNLVTGSAYIMAFKDSGAAAPKLRCGECRIVADNLPPSAEQAFTGSRGPVFSMTRRQKNHFYYYWMRERPEQIEAFSNSFDDTENLKFQAIRLLLSGSRELEIRDRNR